ncbi:MAG: hypothetical protein IK125_06605 [Lachnospiraceae bacterium]|nr:hypothetical protein [Lachnospiraceae bacterium]
MEDYKTKLEEQLKEVEALLAKSTRKMEELNSVPDHEIRIHKSNGRDQYYLINKLTGERRYIKASELSSLREIAQKGYEKRARKELMAMKQNLEFFIRNYNVQKLNEIYECMAKGRKALIEPLIETDEMFLTHWQNSTFEEMQFYDETEFYTCNGIRVRSKSELIIANMLEQYSIPYKYEKPLHLKGMGEVRPDFSCLKVKSRKEVIWEHFGMMDNMTYANKNVTKLTCYHQNGFYVGENLITTFETSQNQISSKLIKGMIEQYLL